MHLHPLDWIVAAASILICFAPALFFGKRSGKSTSEFFASGRFRRSCLEERVRDEHRK